MPRRHFWKKCPTRWDRQTSRKWHMSFLFLFFLVANSHAGKNFRTNPHTHLTIPPSSRVPASYLQVLWGIHQDKRPGGRALENNPQPINNPAGGLAFYTIALRGVSCVFYTRWCIARKAQRNDNFFFVWLGIFISNTIKLLFFFFHFCCWPARWSPSCWVCVCHL